jgi:hypothetical protein
MVTADQLALAAINYESLQLRSLTQDLLRANTKLSDTPRPTTNDPRILAIAASLIELLALREHQEPPAWTKDIAPLSEPFFLVKAAETMKRLRTLCETQSPEPMRKRRLYAPPNFLEFA